jgi:hypothetical protein
VLLKRERNPNDSKTIRRRYAVALSTLSFSENMRGRRENGDPNTDASSGYGASSTSNDTTTHPVLRDASRRAIGRTPGSMTGNPCFHRAKNFRPNPPKQAPRGN